MVSVDHVLHQPELLNLVYVPLLQYLQYLHLHHNNSGRLIESPSPLDGPPWF